MSDDVKVLPDMIPDIKFNLEALEQFGNDKGVVFVHYAAIPSPIGLKDRGEYRRSDTLDTISENGFIYKKVGEFVGTVLGNSMQNGKTQADNIYDTSMARLMMPKFYVDGKKEISLLPGDRIYARDIELKVDNYQRAEYNPNGTDYLQYPPTEVSILMDSQGKEYTYKRDFKIDKDGNLCWIAGRKNPGTDTDTGEGRIYSVRYKYIAHWYIASLVNEIRITNTSDASNPARMPYQANIQREYIYHNKNRGDAKESNVETHTERTNEEPTESLDPNKYEIKVDINNFE